MSKVISAKVSDETLEKINAERHGDPPDYDESRSAVVKRLLHRGLEADDGDNTVGPAFVVLLVGAIFVSAAFMNVGTDLGYLGMALVLLSATEGIHGLLNRLMR